MLESSHVMRDCLPSTPTDPFVILATFAPPAVMRRFSDKSDWQRWVGAGTMRSMDEIRLLDQEFPEARRAGYLLIGNCGNGDWIALDLANGAVGYEPHEWLGDSFAWRATFLPVSRSLEAFFAEANNPSLDNWFPNDWFEGVDRLRAFDSSLRVPDGYEGIDLTGRPPLVDLHCHTENSEPEPHAEAAGGAE